MSTIGVTLMTDANAELNKFETEASNCCGLCDKTSRRSLASNDALLSPGPTRASVEVGSHAAVSGARPAQHTPDETHWHESWALIGGVVCVDADRTTFDQHQAVTKPMSHPQVGPRARSCSPLPHIHPHII